MDEEKDQENINNQDARQEPTPDPVSDVVASEQPDPEVGTEQPVAEQEVFVDNPATQPPLPENMQNQEQQKPKGKKSKKVLFLILLMVLVGAAAAYYFLVMAKEESQMDTNTNEETTTTRQFDAMFYQTNSAVKFYDVANASSVDGATIPEGAMVLASSNDGNDMIYATYTTDSTEVGAEAGPLNMNVYKENGDEDTLLLKTKTFTEQYSASPAVSADMKKIVYYASEDGEVLYTDAKIYTAELDGSNTETELVDATTEQHGPLRPAVWSADNSSVYLAAASCYQCDGPHTSNVWKLNVADKELSNVFKQPGDTSSGQVVVSPDQKTIAVAATAAQELGDSTFANNSDDGFDVYTIDLADDSSKKVYSEIEATDKTAEAFQVLAGWTQDSQGILIGVPKITLAPSGMTDFTQTFERFDLVAVVDGKVTDIPVEAESLNSSWDFTATIYKETLFFTANDGKNDDDTDYTYSLYSLFLTDGVSEIKTIESDQVKVNILGSGSVTAQE